MRRGTTPTLQLTVAGISEITDIEKLQLIIKQYGNVIEKTGEDVKVNGEVVTATLSQEETLSLTAKAEAQIQIRLLSGSGTAYASNIVSTPVCDILNEGVI